MKSDHQTVLSLELKPDSADALASWISEAWQVAVVQFSKPNHDRVWFDLYFATDAEARIAEKVLEKKKGVVATHIRAVAPREWQSFWKHHFKGMDIGKRLRIDPVWEKKRAKHKGKIIIRLDPGLSFGTGDHFTTRFCLEMLDRVTAQETVRSMLDVGSGSGVLAIAAAKLGCKKVAALDNDPQAVLHAEQNAALNDLKEDIKVRVFDIVNDSIEEKFDVVCANLYAQLLVDAAPKLVRSADRWIVLSGIREMEVDRVADVYDWLGAREVVRDGDGEWAGLMFEKRKK